MQKIADTHCDLLSYLAHKPGRTPWDTACRCSIPQLKEGHVQLQTLAIYTETGTKSVEEGKKQVACFQELISQFPGIFTSFQAPSPPAIQLIAAFENASGFSLETEPLSVSLARLEEYIEKIGPIFYISLTWNGENRFGGGTGSPLGLKRDGKDLMEFLSGKKIALDLSHASDALAEDILNHIDANGLDIAVIASHSNFRAVTNQPRNLPDSIAKEIIRRKGLIGLNLVASFLHPTDPSVLLRHVEYALDLGAEDALCWGADFFYASDFPHVLEKYETNDLFLPEHANASCYPRLLEAFSKQLRLNEELLSKIAHGNVLRFLYRT